MRQHVDANNFVSANNDRGLDESRNTSGNSLNRRTSVMEPVGNTYGGSGSRSSRYMSGGQGQDYEAYNAAGSGGHGFDEGASRPTSAFERRQTRGNGTGYY